MRLEGSAGCNIFDMVNTGPDPPFNYADSNHPLLRRINLENPLSFGELSLLN
jgi:hypothetical protein